MNRTIWEFLANGKEHVMRNWMHENKISVGERAKLDHALHRLRTLDRELLSHKLLAPLGDRILKLRLRCENRELRPMLCRGPVGDPLDYTLLLGAMEVGDRLVPHDAKAQADANRIVLKKDHPTWRQIF